MDFIGSVSGMSKNIFIIIFIEYLVNVLALLNSLFDSLVDELMEDDSQSRAYKWERNVYAINSTIENEEIRRRYIRSLCFRCGKLAETSLPRLQQGSMV